MKSGEWEQTLERRQPKPSEACFPVSPSAWRTSKKGKPAEDASGHSFRAWSEKLDLVGLSLRTQLESSGLPLASFARTWSICVTASGYGIMKLRLSERRESVQESFLWRTPGARESGISPEILEPIAGGRLGGNNRHFNRETGRLAQFGLTQQAQIYPSQPLFRTPKAQDADRGSCSGDGILKRIAKGQTIRLQDQVNHPSLFATPCAGDSYGGDGGSQVSSLRRDVLMFPIPTAAEFAGLNKSGDGRDKPNKLSWAAALSLNTENGTQPGHVNVSVKGTLNSNWVEWLMGFPIGWTDIGG